MVRYLPKRVSPGTISSGTLSGAWGPPGVRPEGADGNGEGIEGPAASVGCEPASTPNSPPGAESEAGPEGGNGGVSSARGAAWK